MWASVIILVLLAFNLGGHLYKDGEYKKQEKYNFWSMLIVTIMELILFYYAGMFNCFLN